MSAINVRDLPVHIVKVPAHVGLHGNEVADSIGKRATDDASADSVLGSHLVHFSDTDSVHPRGIGTACPWEVVSPSIRKAACVETVLPAPVVKGTPFNMFNFQAMLDRMAREDFQRTLLKPGKFCPTALPGPSTRDPLTRTTLTAHAGS